MSDYFENNSSSKDSSQVSKFDKSTTKADVIDEIMMRRMIDEFEVNEPECLSLDILGHYVVKITISHSEEEEQRDILEFASRVANGHSGKLLSWERGFAIGTQNKSAMIEIEEDVIRALINSDSLKSEFVLSTFVMSPFSVKTEKFGERTLSEMSFIREGRIDQKIAAEIIFEQNAKWFQRTEDIHYVKLLRMATDDDEKFVIEMKVNRSVVEKIKATKSKQHFNFASAKLKVRIITRSDQCYRCLDIGHKTQECPRMLPLCRFDAQKHWTWACWNKYNENKRMCYKCIQWNQRKSADQDPIDAKHQVYTVDCPLTEKFA